MTGAEKQRSASFCGYPIQSGNENLLPADAAGAQSPRPYNANFRDEVLAMIRRINESFSMGPAEEQVCFQGVKDALMRCPAPID